MVLELLEKRSSVRKFTETKISNEIKEKLEKAFILSPTAQGMQSCSVIEITSKEMKEKLSEIAGQAYIRDVSLIYIFIVDHYKYMSIKDEKIKSLGINYLISGHIDAVIAAHSMYLTAEDLGLSGFYSTFIVKDTNKIVNLLKLPKFTYPVMGLCLGYKNEEPMKKPRLDKKYRIFSNHYKIYENYEEEFKDYDEKLNEYIDLRNPSKTIGKFTDIIKSQKIFKDNKEEIRKQGFEI
ncbi:nitroreductase family protein [Oceanivirga miroungae]|uniref:Nitroreductase n=1 Tax=Oceanivirga miroungae TaxID=1130046 RepID=A0A6I8ME68_9FUSO|nr:nitroreductase family protein [Oceanivirga miroungae]VWL85871.1 nitroreductase [Oceanivirga miroungae]